MQQASSHQRKWRRQYLAVLGSAFLFLMGLVYAFDDGLRLPRGGRRLDAGAILQYQYSSTTQESKQESSTLQPTSIEKIEATALAEISGAALPSVPSSRPLPPALLNSTLALDEYPVHVLDVFDAVRYQVRGLAFDDDLGTAVLVAGQPCYIDLKAVASLNATQSL